MEKKRGRVVRLFDVCSGIGGMSLGLERAGMTTVAFCEIDPFCRKILKKHWPDVPVFEDLKELASEPRGTIPEFDIIAGGVPCQPFSVANANKRKGQEDDRHLWPFMFEIIKQQEPAFVLVENVAGFVNMALDDVLTDLESEGYASQSYLIPACSVDAPHRRERCWVISYSDRRGKPEQIVAKQKITKRITNHCAYVADSKGERMERHWTSGVEESQASSGSRLPRRNSARGEPAVWPPEPWVGRVADGGPNRVDRIKGLGNAVVPPLVEVLGHAIMEEYYGP